MTRRELLLVLSGGALGTAARWLAGLALPAVDGFPWATLAVNLLGALLLGVLLEALLVLGPDEGHRRAARLLLGTGFLGSFTTMSALSVDVLLLGRAGRAGLALVYLAASLVGGAMLAWLGILWGQRLRGQGLTGTEQR